MTSLKRIADQTKQTFSICAKKRRRRVALVERMTSRRADDETTVKLDNHSLWNWCRIKQLFKGNFHSRLAVHDTCRNWFGFQTTDSGRERSNLCPESIVTRLWGKGMKEIWIKFIVNGAAKYFSLFGKRQKDDNRISLSHQMRAFLSAWHNEDDFSTRHVESSEGERVEKRSPKRARNYLA